MSMEFSILPLMMESMVLKLEKQWHRSRNCFSERYHNGPASSSPGLFTNLNGIVLFAADDGITGRELWGSNGTTTGTILVKDIQPGAIASNPTALKRVGNMYCLLPMMVFMAMKFG